MHILERRKTTLQNRLAELEGRLHGIDKTLVTHNTRDWEEAAVEREDDEMLEDLGNAGKAEIARIHAALKRIDEGEYGFCVKCGEEISEERLDVLPDTPFCRKCSP
ncbi:MAG: TraR/DksA family transcriptional regulator [Rhodobacteraceae bacterium]|jgi:RNA polymerase-binding transcription factor DksA|nr:TraR/DksA C4-type zinc finger protein [Alphaproteobacteria bacterium]NNF70584.1 TraR/DksA family transcriptional regulator [Paracoccaceae bacterium]NNK66426.1 TraR/DksA family transcriptional regulator [Paracoccaceae bacterium]